MAPAGPPGPLQLRPDLWLSDRPVTLSVAGLSMWPTLREGDRAEVVLARREELAPGDLVVFVREGELAVHRLLAVTSTEFLEIGDGQGRGNWHPWPGTLGLVVALAAGSGGPARDLRSPEARGEARGLARRLRRRHRAARFAEALPGEFLRRIARRLLRPVLAFPPPPP